MPALLLVVWYLLANNAGTPDIPPQGRGGLLAFASYTLYTLAKLGPYQNFLVGHAGDFTRQPLLYGAGVIIDLAFAVLFVVPLFVRIVLPVAQRRFSPAARRPACPASIPASCRRAGPEPRRRSQTTV